MRIFFSLRHPGTLRNLASTVRLLAARGHDVHLSFTMQDKLGDGRLLWELSREHPSVTVGDVVGKTPWRFWLRLARATRAGTDYIRYLSPEYQQATSLRARADEKTPKAFRTFCRLPIVRSAAGRRLVGAFLGLVERAIPSDGLTEEMIAAQKPDVVLVSPLVDFSSDQVDVVKSAKALGLPTGLCVHSWDNLTNKGLIRLIPDRVFVWNEFQKREAIAMHGVPATRVVVTGAPSYDQWFGRVASRSREDFCREIGFSPDKPIVLYLCSSPFIAANEADFIRTWIDAVRSSDDPRLASANVLVRPHPENVQPWHRVGLDALQGVAVWPPSGANPVDQASKNDYFDSLYHCAAVVGVNTSAMIEAGIVGRAVFTIRAPEFAGTQNGTLHFRYLVEVGGGLLKVADDFDQHRRQLAGALARANAEEPAARPFVESFVRPRGVDCAATPLLADGIEELAKTTPRVRVTTPWWLLPLRACLFPFAWALKAKRDLERVTRKRERALRPLTIADAILHVPLKLVEWLMRWEFAKDLVRRHVVPRVLPRGIDVNEPTEEMVAVPRLVAKLAKREQPLVVGPWVDDVGAELLYWIPFLHWAKAQGAFDADRTVVVSRGGAAAWYAGLGAAYVDLYDFFTPDQLRGRITQALTDGLRKHRPVTDFDREVLKLVQVSLGTRSAHLLHPSQMYRLFAPFWRNQASVELVEKYMSFRRFVPIEVDPSTSELPSDYIAVKFTFNDAFPDTPANRAFVETVVDTLTSDTDVVLLNTGLELSGGDDMLLAPAPRLHRIDQIVTPQNNLDVQTKIISRARLFIGSYTGLSLIPPFCGVGAIAFYSNSEALSGRHAELTRRNVAQLQGAAFVPLHVNDWSLIRHATTTASWESPVGPAPEPSPS